MANIIKISTWNVNSIKARGAQVERYLAENAPDVLMIQELKGEEFPLDTFAGMGYQAAFVGQKAYNGVAVLAKNDITVIADRLAGDESDEQARYIEVEIEELRLINVYCPNGNPVGTEKYEYKIAWMGRLYARLKELREDGVPFIIGGDFNVIPEARDCHDPAAWTEDALFLLPSRQRFRALEHLGLTDAFRIFNQQDEQYTFWDYQAGAWQKNNGIRIDHFLLSPEMTDRVSACRIYAETRGWERPSDHVPVELEVLK